LKPADALQMGLLAAIWGASFMFMRIATPEFGPWALCFLRVAIAAACLLPLVVWHRQLAALRGHWRQVLWVGILNSALPFVCFAAAALAINAGLSSIFNATAPLWGALIARLWLHDRLSMSRLVGLAIGFAGVAGLALGKASLLPGEHGISPALAIALCLLATACYGYAANYTRRYLQDVPPLTLAAGSQAAATAVLLVPALIWWPAQDPSTHAWSAVATLGLLCTGVAYVIFFRLIARIGATTTISVTFLIPVFGMLWGSLLLGEALTSAMLWGCAVILVGTALCTGIVKVTREA
jgi:drug/metabolite transporter (DMT)-like permease